MLSWKVGIITDFGVSVGKSAKYLYRWIGEEEYQRYLNTYFGGNTEEAWKAVLAMGELFDEVTEYVADGLGYAYDPTEGRAAAAYLKHVRELPKDAKQVY